MYENVSEHKFESSTTTVYVPSKLDQLLNHLINYIHRFVVNQLYYMN